MERREFLGLAGTAGVVFASGLPGFAKDAAQQGSDFVFLQMSDTHWGFDNLAINPRAATALPTAVERVNALSVAPDFVVFTGDLTHTTDDADERRRRLGRFREIAGGLRVKDVRFMPGEHDAALDAGAAYRELVGEPHYAFDHKGVHFIALDNVTDPGGSLGAAQLAWLRDDLGRQDRDQPIVVLAHRPLFELYPAWDWTTRDGADALAALEAYRNVTVFYGHIHQENHHMTGRIAHHSAKSLMFPLPAPGSVPKRAPLPWDAAHPYRGLGFRTVSEARGSATAQEHPLGSEAE